jgi:hypothetical protein
VLGLVLYLALGWPYLGSGLVMPALLCVVSLGDSLLGWTA